MSTLLVAKSNFFAAVNLSCFVVYFNEVFYFLRNICHMVLPTCQKLWRNPISPQIVIAIALGVLIKSQSILMLRVEVFLFYF